MTFECTIDKLTLSLFIFNITGFCLFAILNTLIINYDINNISKNVFKFLLYTYSYQCLTGRF